MHKSMQTLIAATTTALLLACGGSVPTDPDVGTTLSASFDDLGYNDVAGVFNGPADGVDKILDGKVWGDPTYANDHLVMKWNSDWDRGNDEEWANPPYRAWTTNEWNGQVTGGSGEIWHYKIQWIGSCGAYGTVLPDGGYCIWGQFEVLLSQGTIDNQHFWDAIAKPAGLGR